MRQVMPVKHNQSFLEHNDLDDAAPTITSGDTAITINENSGSDQVVYTATADDSGDDVADSPIPLPWQRAVILH
jgi:hypothetical protein